MSNPFSQYGKRFYPYSAFLKERYGRRTAKIPLDGGFTCPNRDGTKGTGGCMFCSAYGSGDFIACPQKSIRTQYDEYRGKISDKWADALCIPYFQSFTNTYAPVSRLRKLYDEALALPDAVGLSIATRPDCLSEDVCALLAEYAAATDLTVELGIQTAFDATAAACNMHHSWADAVEAVERLHGIGCSICVHLINGLPNETHEQMVASARRVGALGIDGIKLHLLHVLRGTALAETDYTCLSQEKYIAIVCDQLEVLPPNVVIQRLTGDGKGDDLLASDWSRNKRAVLNGIDREMKRRNSWQGKCGAFNA